MSDLTHEEMLEAAFYMVGNLDTKEDKDAWWKQFGDYWDKTFQVDNGKNGKAERAQKNSDILWKELSNG